MMNWLRRLFGGPTSDAPQAEREHWNEEREARFEPTNDGLGFSALEGAAPAPDGPPRPRNTLQADVAPLPSDLPR